MKPQTLLALVAGAALAWWLLLRAPPTFWYVRRRIRPGSVELTPGFLWKGESKEAAIAWASANVDGAGTLVVTDKPDDNTWNAASEVPDEIEMPDDYVWGQGPAS